MFKVDSEIKTLTKIAAEIESRESRQIEIKASLDNVKKKSAISRMKSGIAR